MDKEFLKQTMLEEETWAVVGVSANPEKFGNRIYHALKLNGYRVYAVNPSAENIDGDACYPDIASLPVIPSVVNLVVSPKNGQLAVEEAGRLGVAYLWFQPGTHDPALISKAEALGMKTLQDCVLVALGED